jgi:hypothetical protein
MVPQSQDRGGRTNDPTNDLPGSGERSFQSGNGWRPRPFEANENAAAPSGSGAPKHSWLRAALRIASITLLLLIAILSAFQFIYSIGHHNGTAAAAYMAVGALSAGLLAFLIRGGKVRIAGEARLIEWRHEQDSLDRQIGILSFRLERYDPTGNRVGAIPVEMRARKFAGVPPSEGDFIEIKGRWKEGQLLRTKRIYNNTTKSKFSRA